MTPFYELTIKSKILICAIVAFYTVVGQGIQEQNGYQCGNVVFTDHIIQETLAMIPSGADKPRGLPYEGLLYSRSKGYLIWPIYPPWTSLQSLDDELGIQQTSLRDSLYLVVFDERGKVIDLIVRLVNNEYGKCLRTEKSLPETSRSAREENNGYQCGYDFISDDMVEKSISATRADIDRGIIYPSPSIGDLYGHEHNLKVWPIHSTLIHRKQQGLENLYFVVVDSPSQVKDLLMVSATFHFLKCIRSRYYQPPPHVSTESSASRSRDNIPPKTQRSGFLCNEVFFSDDELQVASELVMKRSRSKSKFSFPQRYNGPLFDSPCLFWPVRPNKRAYANGKYGPYRLVLTMDYKVMTVIMESGTFIKKCERRSISGGQPKNVNKYTYECDYELFLHRELEATAKVACERLSKPEMRYPTRYNEYEFDIQGPYFIFPIIKNKNFVSAPGNHRLVINIDCEIAGAVTYKKKAKKFVKCNAIDIT